jgi:hypothetical protein
MNQMRIWKTLLLVMMVFVLSACNPPRVKPSAKAPTPSLNVNDPQAVSRAIKVNRDDFKKITRYVGPYAVGGTLLLGGKEVSRGGDVVFLRAWKTDSIGSINYQIYVMDKYNGHWRFYDSAYDSNGNGLNTTLIDREVGSCSGSGSCSHAETLGLNVTREYLEKNQESGIRFQVSGKAGKEVFFIPGGYIKGFLSAVK